jgi:Ca2+-transporting ATPase
MSRPPRNCKEPLISRRTIILSLLQGIVVLLVTLSIYKFTLNQGRGELEARSFAFITLVIANLGLILSNRCWSRNLISSLRCWNKALFIIIAATLSLMTLVLYVPGLRHLFKLGILHPGDLMLCFGVGIACILWFEVVKYFSKLRTKPIKNLEPPCG